MSAEADPPPSDPKPPLTDPIRLPLWKDLWAAYRLRWKRRRLLWRALRRRRQLAAVADRTAAIGPNAILAVLTVGFSYEWKKGALEWE